MHFVWGSCCLFVPRSSHFVAILHCSFFVVVLAAGPSLRMAFRESYDEQRRSGLGAAKGRNCRGGDRPAQTLVAQEQQDSYNPHHPP